MDWTGHEAGTAGSQRRLDKLKQVVTASIRLGRAESMAIVTRTFEQQYILTMI